MPGDHHRAPLVDLERDRETRPRARSTSTPSCDRPAADRPRADRPHGVEPRPSDATPPTHRAWPPRRPRAPCAQPLDQPGATLRAALVCANAITLMQGDHVVQSRAILLRPRHRRDAPLDPARPPAARSATRVRASTHCGSRDCVRPRTPRDRDRKQREHHANRPPAGDGGRLRRTPPASRPLGRPRGSCSCDRLRCDQRKTASLIATYS